jgi:hypothetical protein
VPPNILRVTPILPIAKLKAANADIEHRDSALRDELAERRDSAKTTRKSRAARDEPEMTIEGVQVNREEFIAETIVRRTGRPVLAILRDEGQLTFTDPHSVVWKPRLEGAKAHLVKAARAIGRIEVEGHALTWLGTGWLVDRDIIVTNRHVASEFGRRRGTGFVFRLGLRGTAMSADIDFIEEFGRTDSLVFRLARILHLEDENGPDVAFLRVEAVDGQTLAMPILETGLHRRSRVSPQRRTIVTHGRWRRDAPCAALCLRDAFSRRTSRSPARSSVSGFSKSDREAGRVVSCHPWRGHQRRPPFDSERRSFHRAVLVDFKEIRFTRT